MLRPLAPSAFLLPFDQDTRGGFAMDKKRTTICWIREASQSNTKVTLSKAMQAWVQVVNLWNLRFLSRLENLPERGKAENFFGRDNLFTISLSIDLLKQ
jgi:hypothetical protein